MIFSCCEMSRQDSAWYGRICSFVSERGAQISRPDITSPCLSSTQNLLPPQLLRMSNFRQTLSFWVDREGFEGEIYIYDFSPETILHVSI